MFIEVLIVLLVMIFIICIADNHKKEKERIELEKQEDENREKEQKEQALMIYDKCIENNILDINENNRDKLKIIANSYGIDDIDQVEELFYEGEKIRDEEKLNLKKHIRELEIRKYDEDKELSSIKGKLKYVLNFKIQPYYSMKLTNFKEIYYYRSKENLATSNNIIEKLYDDKDIDEKSKLIKFGKIKMSKTKGLNILVQVKIYVKQNLKILDNEAILDGSFKATIYNQDNKEIGQGYFSAPGFGHSNFSKIPLVIESLKHSVNLDIYHIGFNDLTGMNFLCYIKNPDDVKDDINNYTCKIEPINLWLIEKKDKYPHHSDKFE